MEDRRAPYPAGPSRRGTPRLLGAPADLSLGTRVFLGFGIPIPQADESILPASRPGTPIALIGASFQTRTEGGSL